MLTRKLNCRSSRSLLLFLVCIGTSKALGLSIHITKLVIATRYRYKSLLIHDLFHHTTHSSSQKSITSLALSPSRYCNIACCPSGVRHPFSSACREGNRSVSKLAECLSSGRKGAVAVACTTIVLSVASGLLCGSGVLERPLTYSSRWVRRLSRTGMWMHVRGAVKSKMLQ